MFFANVSAGFKRAGNILKSFLPNSKNAKTLKSDSIVDSRLFIGLDLDVTSKTNSLFQTSPSNRAHLANQLLLYDKILIPTKDYGIIPILINWLGLKTFRKALDSDAFSFLHRKTLLGYAGNGVGISGYIISESKALTFEWWQHALFGSTDLAVEQQLKHMCPFIEKKERAKIFQKILSCTRDVVYDNEFFMKQIVQESYTDILSNQHLSQFVLDNSSQKRNQIDLTRLEGINPDQMRTLNINRMRDPIDLVLRVAEINMEIYMSTLESNADLFTSQGAEELLKQKLIRAGIGSNYVEGFLSLLELNKIPDIGEAVRTDSLTLANIWKIREKRKSKNFREWLRTASSKDSEEIRKLYVDCIGNIIRADSLPVKVCKFAVTSFIGDAISPNMGGPIAGAIEIFFVEKWLKGYSPTLFLDELSKLQEKRK